MVDNIIKKFGMSNLFIELEIRQLEEMYGYSLKNNPKNDNDKDNIYYPQFEKAIRQEASEMARHYEVFYCLENSIRDLISKMLKDTYGPNWWETKVSLEVKRNVTNNMNKEIDSGVTQRSEEPIDYTTFGELGEIIKQNWDIFGSVFSSIKAVEKVMASLNLLRAPIAHCSRLAEDEIVRLKLALRDWFRLME